MKIYARILALIYVKIYCTFSFICLLADVMLMLVYWKNDEEAWAALTLAFFIVPAIIMQVIKYQVSLFINNVRDLVFYRAGYIFYRTNLVMLL